MNEELCVKCPHCNEYIYVLKSQINCNVFRHGIYKSNLKQIDPHTSKEVCDRLLNDGKIIGCGKPFSLLKKEDNTYIAIKCDYI